MLYSKTSGTSTVIAQNDFGYSAPFAWSSNSRLVAYTDRSVNQTGFIRIYDVKEAKSYQLTSGRQEAYSPRFSRDGNWLYFISERTLTTSVRSRGEEDNLNRTTIKQRKYMPSPLTRDR